MAKPGDPEYLPISCDIFISRPHVYHSCRHCNTHTNKFVILRGLNANHIDMDSRIQLCLNCFGMLKTAIATTTEK